MQFALAYSITFDKNMSKNRKETVNFEWHSHHSFFFFNSDVLLKPV